MTNTHTLTFAAAKPIGTLLLLLGALTLHGQTTNEPAIPTEIAAIESEMNAAIDKVKGIVNQKVGAYRRTPGMKVVVYQNGWFHDGAIKPDFETVDIRTTRETDHSKSTYVSSDLNPGYVWMEAHLEFNPMTKYFYTDRTVPKKRLTEAEMIEINRLYRIIGACERKIRALQPRPKIEPRPDTGVDAETVEMDEPPTPKYEPVPRENYIKAIVGVSLILGIYFVYRIVKK